MAKSAKPDHEILDEALTLPDFAPSAQTALRKHRKRLAKAFQAARESVAEEAVHELRISCRRVLALLDLLEPIVGGKRRRAVRKPLRALMKATGRPRDHQVQLGYLSGIDRLAALVPRMRKAADKETARLGKYLRKFDMAAVGDDLRKAEKAIPRRVAAGSSAIQSGRYVFDVLRETFFVARERAAEALQGQPDALHELRLAMKRLRYKAEALGILHDVGPTLANQVRRIQDELGEIQDLTVLEAHLMALPEDVQDEAFEEGLHSIRLRRDARSAEFVQRLRGRMARLRTVLRPIVHML